MRYFRSSLRSSRPQEMASSSAAFLMRNSDAQGYFGVSMFGMVASAPVSIDFAVILVLGNGTPRVVKTRNAA